MTIYLGQAGWSLPSMLTEKDPEGLSGLQRYARRFSAVEVNSSFYRHHRRSTYERWAAQVPERFRFAVKVPRAITHYGRLVDDAHVLDRFLDEVSGLGAKLGPLLVQLPPSLAYEEHVALDFLTELHGRMETPIVCEPRHPSWFHRRPLKQLADLAISLVVADPLPCPEAALAARLHSDLYYLRLHGSPVMYYSSYSPNDLAEYKQRLLDAEARGAVPWCIFDNTAQGASVFNALALGLGGALPEGGDIAQDGAAG